MAITQEDVKGAVELATLALSVGFPAAIGLIKLLDLVGKEPTPEDIHKLHDKVKRPGSYFEPGKPGG
jgi:hypothetical protein